jgi:membrane fusion protein, heavy metal efflux system
MKTRLRVSPPAASAVLAALVLALCGCGDRRGDAAVGAERPAAAPAPGAFCSAHGVAEAVCTRCNPRLIPIFQERGDWCAEHDFPESFCPACHPERGGRPAVSIEADGPADGTRIQLATPQTARMAGIETVEAREVVSSGGLEVLATIAYDATRRAEVNARAPGIVREILCEVGQRVEAGAPLVRIESAEVGAAQSRLLAARSRVAVAQAAHTRQQALLEAGMSSQKDLEAAGLERDTALAEQSAAESSLAVIGLDGVQGSTYTLFAPLAGSCVQRSATLGRSVGAEEALFEIVDTASMWAELDIPEGELQRVRVGQPVTVTADSLAGREFSGAIVFIAPSIDPHTRTARARVRLDNPEGLLRANLYVRARIEVGREEVRVVVPRSSVQRAGTVQLVFVELDPASFETRRVRTAAADEGLVELLQGVRAGERVVTQGSFLLKTETLKGEIGAGCCEG